MTNTLTLMAFMFCNGYLRLVVIQNFVPDKTCLLSIVFLFMTVSDLSLSQGALAQVAREWTHQLQTFSTAN